jgi:hypothetical protein
MHQEAILKTYNIWLLKLVLPVRFGRLLTGVLLFVMLYSFFKIGSAGTGGSPALFFSLILAYIIPTFSFITEKVEEALLELRPILELDDQAFEQARAQLNSASRPKIAFHLLFGILFGFAHLSLIEGSFTTTISEMFGSTPEFVSSFGALSVWTVMTTVTSMLIQQTVLFARLGKNQTQISLLNKRRLLPFARVSIISSLSIIGALALFPLMSVDSGLDFSRGLPGAIATLGPLLAIFIIPVWPVHRRLAALKEQELAALDDEIDRNLNSSGRIELDPEKLKTITPLLSYRQEISGISTWPFDGGALTRLAFYLIIPPLTWAGAALIEALIDRAL